MNVLRPASSARRQPHATRPRARLAALALPLAATLALVACGKEPPATEPVRAVRTMTVGQLSGATTRDYAAEVHARVESRLAFRVGGKIFERLVDPGDRVKRGQPLMRLDRTDFTLALNAARASVEAARAQMIKAKADEERSRKLVADGWTSKQTYDQNKGAADAAIAQFANAEAQAGQIENQAGYAELKADADGVVMEVPSYPGEVVAAGPDRIPALTSAAAHLIPSPSSGDLVTNYSS